MRAKITAFLCFGLLLQLFGQNVSAKPAISEHTQECLGCHKQVTPGIVADWEKSVHAQVSVAEALKKPALSQKISSPKIPDHLQKTVVGCAECHELNPDRHKDSFMHNGHNIHIVVSPPDCAVCHALETEQFTRNKMSQAHGNLMNNPLYHNLQETINGMQFLDGGKITLIPPDKLDSADSCLHCHGTIVETKGMRKRQTLMGEMEFPILTGWPNQGVGRINPDGSRGICTSCHTRHRFSIEMARKPDPCRECHKGPDVVAYDAYTASKHGNIYSALGDNWNFSAVPWTVGKDFTAPTCAVCHIALLVNPDGEIIASRTHQMNDRLFYRLFGLIYAHPQPKSADTTIIKNKAGLPIPTELTGEPVAEYLIDETEQEKREKTLQKICAACHSKNWVEGKFKLIKHTIQTSNKMTLTATKILLKAWETGAAKGMAQNDSIFNEPLEKMWVEQWLFYANSTRISSAMGGPDYAVFENGRWHMSKNIQEMYRLLNLLEQEKK